MGRCPALRSSGTDLNTSLLEHGTAGSSMEGDAAGINLEV